MQEGLRRAGARDRASLSCTECRRKKKKCSAGNPCQRCLRTFPPVDCIYAPVAASGGRSQPAKPPNQDGMDDSMSIVNFASGDYLPRDVDLSSERRNSSSTTYSSTSSAVDVSLRTASGHHSVNKPHRGSFVWSLPLSKYSGQYYPDISPINPPVPPKIVVDLEPDVVDNSDDNFDEIVQIIDLKRRGNDGIVMGSAHGTINPVIGFTMFDLLRLQSIAPTRNYAHLLSLYVEEVVPVVITIDGSDFRNNWFVNSWIPLTVESPVLLRANLHNAILFRMSRLVQMPTNLPLTKEQKMKQMNEDLQSSLTLRLEIITLLNRGLKASKLPPDDALAAVMLFIWYEFVPGNWKEVFYHTRGLAAIVKMRGGLKAFGIHGMLRKLIILQHLNVAIVTETRAIPILLDDYARPSVLLPLLPKLSYLASPLCSNLGTFTLNRSVWDLGAESATLLDHVAFLTMKIHGHVTSKLHSKEIESDIVVEAAKIQDYIFLAHPKEPIDTTDSPLPHTTNAQTGHHVASGKSNNGSDPYYNTILAAADLYTSAILSRTPLCKSYSKSTLVSLLSAVPLVGMDKWARVPGVWLWILLIVNTVVRSGLKRGWFQLRGQQQSASFEIALHDWELAVGCLQHFMSVQEWLRSPSEQDDSGNAFIPSMMELIDLEEPDEHEYSELLKILSNQPLKCG